MAPEATSEVDKKIYLSRRSSRARAIENEPLIEDHFSELGYEIVVADELSVTEQRDKFADCRRLVALHGAGLTNMLWMPPNSEIVEIFTPELTNYCYASMASKLGFSYQPVLAEAKSAASIISRIQQLDEDHVA